MAQSFIHSVAEGARNLSKTISGQGAVISAPGGNTDLATAFVTSYNAIHSPNWALFDPSVTVYCALFAAIDQIHGRGNSINNISGSTNTGLGSTSTGYAGTNTGLVGTNTGLAGTNTAYGTNTSSPGYGNTTNTGFGTMSGSYNNQPSSTSSTSSSFGEINGLPAFQQASAVASSVLIKRNATISDVWVLSPNRFVIFLNTQLTFVTGNSLTVRENIAIDVGVVGTIIRMQHFTDTKSIVDASPPLDQWSTFQQKQQTTLPTTNQGYQSSSVQGYQSTSQVPQSYQNTQSFQNVPQTKVPYGETPSQTILPPPTQQGTPVLNTVTTTPVQQYGGISTGQQQQQQPHSGMFVTSLPGQQTNGNMPTQQIPLLMPQQPQQVHFSAPLAQSQVPSQQQQNQRY